MALLLLMKPTLISQDNSLDEVELTYEMPAAFDHSAKGLHRLTSLLKNQANIANVLAFMSFDIPTSLLEKVM